MSLMEETLYRITMNTPVSVDAANDGVIMTLLLVAVGIIVLKPNFSRI